MGGAGRRVARARTPPGDARAPQSRAQRSPRDQADGSRAHRANPPRRAPCRTACRAGIARGPTPRPPRPRSAPARADARPARRSAREAFRPIPPADGPRVGTGGRTRGLPAGPSRVARHRLAGYTRARSGRFGRASTGEGVRSCRVLLWPAGRAGVDADNAGSQGSLPEDSMADTATADTGLLPRTYFRAPRVPLDLRALFLALVGVRRLSGPGPRCLNLAFGQVPGRLVLRRACVGLIAGPVRRAASSRAFVRSVFAGGPARGRPAASATRSSAALVARGLGLLRPGDPPDHLAAHRPRRGPVAPRRARSSRPKNFMTVAHLPPDRRRSRSASSTAATRSRAPLISIPFLGRPPRRSCCVPLAMISTLLILLIAIGGAIGLPLVGGRRGLGAQRLARRDQPRLLLRLRAAAAVLLELLPDLPLHERDPDRRRALREDPTASRWTRRCGTRRPR